MTGADRRRWRVLALGHAARTASCTFLYGIPFLVPSLRADSGLSLAQAGTVVAAPSMGLLLTLVAWGAAADRYGERRIMALGLGGSGLLLSAASAFASEPATLTAMFVLAGAATASVNASGGRVVMGWFSAAERGVAMGIRQTAQPVGVGLAALGLPSLAQQWGFHTALLLPAGRLGAGYWSDRAGSRLRPMRLIAVGSAAVMAALAAADVTVPWVAVVVLTLAAVVTVADNGLGFTASAELAGSAWAGRAMGAQNTA